jgi:hypothetical protein
MKSSVYLLVFSFLFLTSACEREVPFEPGNYTQKLVVNSLFSNETPLRVRVSKSISVLDSSRDYTVANASVQLITVGSAQSLLYDAGGDYYYLPGSPLPSPGTQYALQIQAPGFVTARAEAKLPALPTNFSFELKENVGVDNNGIPQDKLILQFDDDANTANYYQFMLLYYSQFSATFIPFKPDNAITENVGLVGNADGSYLLSDKGRNGQKIVLEFTIPFDQSIGSPRFMIEFASLNRDFYEYQRTIALNNQTGISFGPFFNNPVQVYTNIQNGLGIFASRFLYRDTLF